MTEAISRRAIIAGSAAAVGGALIPFPEWFGKFGAANAQVPLVRYSVQSSQGAAMLAKYAVAVDKMMGKDLGEACSWNFQWYTHQIHDGLTKASAVASIPGPKQALANDMWNTCQGHPGRPLRFFLPWHRMYVYFLERIVRAASGDPAFTLPYWDYMDPTQRGLPASFLLLPGPLFRQDRNDGTAPYANVKGGQRIDATFPPGTIDFKCLGDDDYATFNSDLNNNPHGMVHSLIGNGVGMGSVPWAGNDPIFWLHHCNIDRMWASWNNQSANINPGDAAWRDQTFIFADENCNRVVAKVADFATIAGLGYSYDKLIPVINKALIEKIKRLRLIAQFRRPGPIPESGQIRVPLGPEPVVLRLGPSIRNRPLSTMMKALPVAKSVRLVISNLRADAAPGTIFLVYINLPKNASSEDANRHYAGAITFFDAVVAEHGEMAGMKGMDMTKMTGPTFSLDVTDVVRGLGSFESLDVTIRPAAPPVPGAKASFEDVQLLAG